MASEKQIAANRRNAKRSTGPRTAAGKLRTSQNAYLHGLSIPLAHFSQMPDLMEKLAQASGYPVGKSTGSFEIAYAMCDLSGIRIVRSKMLSVLEPQDDDPVLLKRLMALDRYEWRALAKRRRAENGL